MRDPIRGLIDSPPARALLRRAGVPAATPLRRHTPRERDAGGTVELGAAEGGLPRGAVAAVVEECGLTPCQSPPPEPAADRAPGPDGGPAALVFDATGITGPDGLSALHRWFHPRVRGLRRCGRVVVLGRDPAREPDPATAAAQQGLEGFVRSLGKELGGRGTTCQLLRVAPGAEGALGSPLRFLLSPRSAFVSGQVVLVEPADAPAPARWELPLDGAAALVTGAARGIGAVIAEVLARDGAHVVCVDLPAGADELHRVAARVRGSALPLDITAPEAPARIAAHLRERHGGVDVVVHNAGITRDRTLARMTAAEWDAVLAVNLAAVQRITAALLEEGGQGPVLRDGGALVAVSSIGGIAGNRGQTNYATSKAALIGLVRAWAPALRERGARVNAVAPGFVETDMTARMPLLVREAGRRMSSLGQGGQPVDIAEAVAWLAAPATAGVNGQVVRVCGQSLLGA
ncbi:3-oxoacyl-ACP reductase [Streptomyces capparidis]